MSSTLWSCGYQIRVTEGANKGQTFPLDAEEVTAGQARHPADRAPGWILLSDPKVSRIHFDLRWVEKRSAFMLIHRSETNPTFVNGQALVLPPPVDPKKKKDKKAPEPPPSEVELRSGDVIRLGDTVLDVLRADFRYGGDDPTNRARPKSLSLGLSPADKGVETKPTSGFVLDVDRGVDRGQRFELTGDDLILSGPHFSDSPVTAEILGVQEVQLNDPKIPPRFLRLEWRARDGGFSMWRLDSPSTAVRVARVSDGVLWTTSLPDGIALVRDGDRILLGDTQLVLNIPQDEE